MKYFIAIPTYNGGNLWESTVKNIKKYAPEGTLVKIIDSGSKDNTVREAINAGFSVSKIESADFNHGGTRNLFVLDDSSEYDIVIFLTQDAVPQRNFIENILSAFKDDRVACAYGRQLPHDDANPLALHARTFNYPQRDYVCDKDSISRMGLKMVFMSNSFSAYRLSVFKELGGFPSNTILCEDMFYTARAILAGYKVAYISEAIVKHSHNYSPREEFSRYFDIGVFHKNESWIRKNFGGAGGEGKKFIFSEFYFLLKKAPLWIPLACVNNLTKIVGYKVGQRYQHLPRRFIVKMSMHKKYWK